MENIKISLFYAAVIAMSIVSVITICMNMPAGAHSPEVYNIQHFTQTVNTFTEES